MFLPLYELLIEYKYLKEYTIRVSQFVDYCGVKSVITRNKFEYFSIECITATLWL